MAWEELQVPDEPGVWKCAKHPNRTTRLRCGRCEKPICTRCTQYGPSGARCRDCLSTKSLHIYQVTPLQFGLSFCVAAVLGAVGSALVPVLGGMWLFALLYAPALGPLIAGVVTRVIHGKRGARLATVTALGLIVGALGAAVGMHLWASPIFWLMLAIAVVGTWTTLK